MRTTAAMRMAPASHRTIVLTCRRLPTARITGQATKTRIRTISRDALWRT